MGLTTDDAGRFCSCCPPSLPPYSIVTPPNHLRSTKNHNHTQVPGASPSPAYHHTPVVSVSPSPGHRSLPFFLPPPPVLPPLRILVNSWQPMSAAELLSRFPSSENEWLAQARFRRAAYTHMFALPALRWVLVEEGEGITDRALQTGTEDSGEPLYSIRAWYNGGLHIGKAGRHIYRGMWTNFAPCFTCSHSNLTSSSRRFHLVGLARARIWHV